MNIIKRDCYIKEKVLFYGDVHIPLDMINPEWIREIRCLVEVKYLMTIFKDDLSDYFWQMEIEPPVFKMIK